MEGVEGVIRRFYGWKGKASERTVGLAKSLFEFLEQFQKKKERTVRDLREYEYVKFACEIPLDENYCYFGEEDDPWLTVHLPEFPEFPEPPNWSRKFLAKCQFDLKNPFAHVPELPDEEDFARVQRNDYVIWRKKWDNWSEKTKLYKRIHSLYNEFFSLEQRLEREGESYQLVWGNGIVAWALDGNLIFHPLLMSRTKLVYNEDDGGLRILPEESPTQFELDFLYGVPQLARNADKLMRLSNAISKDNSQINPWQSEELETIYKEFWKIVGVPPRIEMDRLTPPSANQIPTIFNGPVILLRRRRTGFARFFKDAQAIIEESSSVPPLVARVLEEQTPGYPDCKSGESVSGHSDQGGLMFPLPSNEEQRKVVSKLAKEPGVTLQGPPGTGKSHTICNLICHYLAHGRRILVTAWIGRPLSVIREMLPEDIRSLCIILAGRDVSVLRELEASVSAMENRIVDLQINLEEAECEKLKKRLEDIRGKIAETRKALIEARRAETKKYRLGETVLSAQELAEWLRKNEALLGYIPDEIESDVDIPFNPTDFLNFYELSKALHPNVRQLLEQVRPDPDKLPEARQLEKLYSEIMKIESEVPQGLMDEIGLMDATEDELTECIKKVSALEEIINPNKTPPWRISVRNLLKEHDTYFSEFRDFVTKLRNMCESLSNELRKIEGVKMELTTSVHTTRRELELKVAKLLNKLGGNNEPGFFTRISSSYRHLSNSFRVNGAKPVERKDWKVVQAYLNYLQLKDEIHTYWANKTQAIRHMPPLDSQRDLKVQVLKYCDEIEEEITILTKHWVPLFNQLQKLVPPSSNWHKPKVPSYHNVCALKAKLESIHKIIKLKGLTTKVENLGNYLQQCSNCKKGSPIADSLLQTLKSRDLARWESIRSQLLDLQKKEDRYELMKAMANKLRRVAPRLCNLILEEPTEDLKRKLENIHEAWEWRRAQTWLTNLWSVNLTKLQHDLQALYDEERKVKLNLITKLTWMNLAKSISEDERKSLKSWAQHMRRVGKGKGKHAQKYLRYARDEMQQSKNAVPVWVMPLPLVVENFGPDMTPFDLVIVDESSQCDMTGLAALLLGKQVIIVGDDKQIAPYGIGINEHEIDELLHSYLKDFPRKEQFHPRQSLYDFAVREFPGVIMLKEHFRSVPPIIEFSNHLAYNAEIRPVRSLRPDSLEPLKAVYVKEGYREYPKKLNKPEGDKLVEKVLECCRDGRYEGKTMGVISLLGEEQAQYIMNQLYSNLPLEEIRRRRLVCGHAYHFQGDERDVIFLSVVDSLDIAEGSRERLVAFNKVEHMREINVAASRAKDQCWIFYSVHPDFFHNEDFRGRLIRHYLTYKGDLGKTEALEAKCESPFEKDVLRDLIRKGYTVIPQERVGGYRIDLVVYGQEGLKVGVECDGDQFHDEPEEIERDIIRQSTLERWGWTIHRIRGSEYYRNPTASIDALCDRLKRLGVTVNPH